MRVSMSGSGQAEAVVTDERAEVVALGNRVLAGLVLRPAVALGVAEAVGEALALARRRVARLAAAVVVLHQRLEPAVVVAVGVHGQGGRQAHAAPARQGRIAETRAGQRET